MALITIENIQHLIQSKLDQEKLFVVEITISEKKHITVYLDGIQNVSVSQCTSFARFLREALGELGNDYQITVSSPGLDKPFRHPMQYQKNIDKTVEVLLNDGNKVAGKLLQILEDGSIRIQEFEPMKGNNKSIKPKLSEKITEINPNSIKETKKLVLI